MSNVQGKALDINVLKRIFGYIKPYRGVFVFTALLTILLGFMAPLRPSIIQRVIDDYAAKSQTEFVEDYQLEHPQADTAEVMTAFQDFDGSRGDMVFYFTIIIIGLLILEALMQFAQGYYANWLGQSVTIDLRQKLYRHAIQFRLKYFDNTPIGTIVTRVVSDIDGVANIFSNGLLTIFGDILKLIVVISWMFYVNWKLTLFVLIPIPILVFATRLFKNAIKKAFIEVRNQVSKLNAFVQEHVTGMTIVQLFNRQKREMEAFDEINNKHKKANIRSIWAYAVFFPVVELLSALSVALLFWWGIQEVALKQIEFGTLVEFTLYVFMLYRPIRQLADRFNTLQMGMVNAERVFRVLDTEAFIEDKGTKEANFKGEIEFKDVSFAYVDEDYVLKDINFQVNAGETIAFVGATGSGKTSIINLISRFYHFQKGTILIDGEDSQEFTLDSIRKNIAVVLQDVFLFSDSIYNNITLHDPNITREQVIEASKAVGAHDFIMRLPGNYDYDVKERGTMLSVGQRQLLAFIRAYVYDPKILVLDEATSSVDTESEELIQHAIEKLTKGRTSIVIAHRLSTVQQASKIMVLDKGQILEMGTHNELLLQDGQYKKLFDLQFSD